MSDELRSALKAMKVAAERNPHVPITYLHDPETGKMFAAMIQLDQASKVDLGLEATEHDHLEGDEDEY